MSIKIKTSEPSNYLEEALFSQLSHAAFKGDLEMVDFLLKKTSVNPSYCKNTVIRNALNNNHTAIVNRLLDDQRVNPSADDNYILLWAIEKHRHLAVDRILKDIRVDPSLGNLALRIACYNSNNIAVSQLLERGINPSANNNEAISIAPLGLWPEGSLAIIEILLSDARVDPSANKNAAIRNVRLLRSRNIIDKKNYEKMAALLLKDSRVMDV